MNFWNEIICWQLGTMDSNMGRNKLLDCLVKRDLTLQAGVQQEMYIGRAVSVGSLGAELSAIKNFAIFFCLRKLILSSFL